MKRRCHVALYIPLYYRAKALMKLRDIESFTDLMGILLREEWERRESLGHQAELAVHLHQAKTEPDGPEEPVSDTKELPLS